jgi:hypothetical protein
MALGPLILGEGGWCALREDVDGPDVALVRFEEDPGGRLRIAEVLFRPSGGVKSDSLRELPLARLEARANVPENHERLLDAIRTTGAETVAATDAWVGAMASRSNDPDEDQARTLVSSFASEGGKARRRLRSAQLRHRGTRPRPDSFYEAVATDYTVRAQTSSRPAKDMAAYLGVPETTVHRWVKEARRRGFLPPARSGSAG